MDYHIISRAEAKAKGLSRYFSGKPCKHGHIAERYVSSPGCVECTLARAAARHAVDPVAWGEAVRRRVMANPDLKRMQNARWYNRNKSKHRVAVAKCLAENREGYRQTASKWATNNPDKVKSKLARYSQNHPDKIRAKCRNRRARKKGNGGTHTADDIERIRKAQRGRCAYCKQAMKDKYHVDHIIPLAKGGSNGPANLQLLCVSCNVRKSAKDPIDYARQIGRLL